MSEETDPNIAHHAMFERAQAADALQISVRRLIEKVDRLCEVNETVNGLMLHWMTRAHALERAAVLLVAAWRAERHALRTTSEAWLRDGAAIERLQDALQGLLDDPYGCPLCDCGTPRNPEKGHWPECPYEPARAVLAAEKARNR